MLVDLLNSQNYIMVSMDAIQIFGLNTAVYCSELLNVYKKARIKDKLLTNDYFRIDRDFIATRTSLPAEEQLKCDINLSKVGVIQVAGDDVDLIKFDVATYASILSSEDIKILEAVSEKVKSATVKGSKKVAQARIVSNLKAAIECRDADILFALEGWVDSVIENKKALSKQQVKVFKETLDNYCYDVNSGCGNKDLALKIIATAVANNWTDCQWAIDSYERSQNNFNKSTRRLPPLVATQTVPQRVTTALSDETF